MRLSVTWHLGHRSELPAGEDGAPHVATVQTSHWLSLVYVLCPSRTLIERPYPFKKHMRALQSLGQPIQHWEAIIIHLIVNKFDPATRHALESSISNAELATHNQLINFLVK